MKVTGVFDHPPTWAMGLGACALFDPPVPGMRQSRPRPYTSVSGSPPSARQHSASRKISDLAHPCIALRPDRIEPCALGHEYGRLPLIQLLSFEKALPLRRLFL